jgi:type IV pilus assembly protein PilC
MIKIVPEFVKIFYEFGLELPTSTQLLVAFSEFVVNVLAVPIALLTFFLLLVATVIAICFLCDEPPMQWFADRFFRGRRIADLLRIIALATENREPLPDVLNRVATVYPSNIIRKQVARAASDVGAGLDWREALRRARIISFGEQRLLTTAETVGNLPWALREIASQREKRIVYWFANRLQVFYPLIILALGLFVGFYALSLFIPIVKLINGLSN